MYENIISVNRQSQSHLNYWLAFISPNWPSAIIFILSLYEDVWKSFTHFSKCSPTVDHTFSPLDLQINKSVSSGILSRLFDFSSM